MAQIPCAIIIKDKTNPATATNEARSFVNPTIDILPISHCMTVFVLVLF
ncbi:DNA polymerase III subunit alpha [Fulvimarina pelagi HTCC2506]|uniref:DNA polymerase III subunit alpha n=1 Tax=Fulvimarina pelagi HTCC2506 TaxID=314231 RepID=Q0FZ79_9HYPH|nr:DNA polymerase III subunit alpha [Fulvimarina pelagi HTCC2506]